MRVWALKSTYPNGKKDIDYFISLAWALAWAQHLHKDLGCRCSLTYRKEMWKNEQTANNYGLQRLS